MYMWYSLQNSRIWSGKDCVTWWHSPYNQATNKRVILPVKQGCTQRMHKMLDFSAPGMRDLYRKCQQELCLKLYYWLSKLKILFKKDYYWTISVWKLQYIHRIPDIKNKLPKLPASLKSLLDKVFVECYSKLIQILNLELFDNWQL
jgi:hypothetical protein